jgi:hypothetical protein
MTWSPYLYAYLYVYEIASRLTRFKYKKVVDHRRSPYCLTNHGMIAATQIPRKLYMFANNTITFELALYRI